MNQMNKTFLHRRCVSFLVKGSFMACRLFMVLDCHIVNDQRTINTLFLYLTYIKPRTSKTRDRKPSNTASPYTSDTTTVPACYMNHLGKKVKHIVMPRTIFF